MFDESQLTICTVSYGHAAHLDLNWKLVARLNGDIAYRLKWLVAENAPIANPLRLSGTEQHFTHCPGYADDSRGASHQHAEALKRLVSRARSRFVLILDPDFYILRKNWIADVTAYIKAHNLAFFGAPWHPRYVQNYRYFPAVHCMCIDTEVVPVEELDFAPILSDERGSPSIGAASSWSQVLKRIRLEDRSRESWDTGTRIFNRFGGNTKVRAECVLPVYQVKRDWLGQGNLPSMKSRLLELILPDDRCYLPKRRWSYTSKGFAERGWPIPELPAFWEQHIWREEPFSLHLRRSFASARRDSIAEFDTCRGFLQTLYQARK